MSRNKCWGLEALTNAPLIEMTAEFIPYCKNFFFPGGTLILTSSQMNRVLFNKEGQQ